MNFPIDPVPEELSFPATEFSWSLSRHRTFDFCKRAYFYRYYGARKGWETHAMPVLKQLYLLKNAIRTDTWLHNILVNAVKSTFMTPGPKSQPASVLNQLRRESVKRFFQGRQEILNQSWRQDPKALNLFELSVLDYSPDEWLDNVEFRLMKAIVNFAETPVFDELRGIRYLQWKNLKSPVQFFFEGVNIWTTADLIWSFEGILEILNFSIRQPDNSNFWQSRAAVCLFLAQQKWRVPQNQIRYRLFFPLEPQNQIMTFEDSGTCREIRDLIHRSSDEMMMKISPDEQVHEQNFPENDACNQDHPLNCEFRSFCRNKESGFK